MLVVADQVALGIGRERRLACSREPEEDGDAALVVDVCRAVHREDPLEGEAVVHEREDRLLDLARVERAADHHLAARRVEQDERLAAGPVLVRIRLDRGRVEDERLRAMAGKLVLGGVDEERAREECVPGGLGDDPNGEPMSGIGSGEGVDHVDVAAPEAVDDPLPEALERRLGNRHVHVAPGDAILRLGLADDVAVLRRPARVPPRVDDERPTLGEHGVVPGEGVGIALRDCRIPEDLPARPDPVRLEVGGLGDRHSAVSYASSPNFRLNG